MGHFHGFFLGDYETFLNDHIVEGLKKKVNFSENDGQSIYH